MVKITQMRKTTLRQAAMKLAIVALAVLSPLGLRAQEMLTVNDGTTTNYYVPFYGSYVDTYGCNVEFIIPASTDGMSDMEGGTISKLTFYISNSPQSWGSPTIQVYMGEVDGTTLSSLNGPTNFTVVYTGTISNQTNPLVIEFDEPYTYEGGNLLIGTYVQTASTTYKSTSFYGVSAASGSSICFSGQTYASPNAQSFLPKTTFTYEPAQQGGDVCDKPATCDFSNVTATSATLTWTGGSGTYNVEVKGGEWADWTAILSNTTNTTTTLTLQPTTSYQARVQSVCAGSTPTSGWKTATSITTPCASYDIPYTYGFEDAAPFDCWTVISGTITRISGYPNTGSYRLDFRGTTSNMVALPQFNEATNNLRVEFWTRPESTGGNSGKFAIGYMTDVTDASTFVAVETYNSTAMTTTYVKKTVDMANVPAGAKIAMRQFECATNYYWYVDDVTVKEMPSCVAPTALAANNIATTSANLSWTANSSETAWTIYYKKTTDENYTEVANATNPYTLNDLTAATNYQYYVVANCSSTDASEASEVFNFATACEAVNTFPWSENLESHTGVTSGTTNNLPICWNYINTCTYSSYKGYPVIYNNSSYSTSGNNHLRFYSYYSTYSNYDPQPQYAILPEMSNLDGMRIKLHARGSNATSTFKIGRMTDPTDVSTFVPFEVETGIYEQTLTTAYQEFTYELTGTGDYLAIMIDAATSSRTTNGVYIDDILVEPIPSCTEPSDLQFVSSTTTTATLQWTAGGSETAWDIYVSTENVAPTNSTIPSVSATSDNPATIEGLTHSTTYYVWVRAHCGDGDGEQSPWIGGISFNTECEAVTTFPWSENFENYNASSSGIKFNGICWVNEHISGNGTYFFETYSGTNGTNATKQLRLRDMSNGTMTKLRLPEMNLPNTNYQFTIDVYRNASGSSYTSEGVRVFASTDGEIEGATELGFLYRNCNQTDGNIVTDEGSTGWYTYEFPIPFSGTCYIILRGESQYGTHTYMDNLVVERAPLCRKPSALMLNTPSARTAHTATLKWTNGAEGQNAWQIAYKAGSNFDPNDAEALATATIVDVNTNPATIEGLAQSTTYYAYVRANCGTDGYSDWSIANATFTTLAGNVTPTGLAVAANTITSDQATASWNAVAGNTLHQSYDIYWVESPDAAPVTAVPENPTAPNLISGITATSQVISDLTPETKYRVWVRDNCGTDGLSAWSSYVTFTTASACNTPSNLVASNVTNNSAQLSWAAYGIDDFNLQYRVSGEEWDDNNIITHVNTPYTMDPFLTGNTTYQVRVQAACAEDPTAANSWSNTVSFTTACDAEPFPWSEHFDTWTSKSVCWSFRSGQYNMGQGTPTTYSSAWTLNSSYGDYITIDGKALTMNLYSTYKYWAVTPYINITTDDAVLKVDVAVAAWSSATPNYDDNDTLAFAISTDGGATFTNLRVLDGDDLNNLGNDYTTIYVPVAGYNGQAVRFAIYGGSINNVSSSNDNRCVIDNVSVEEAPSCYPVGTLAEATDITPFSAKLSWGLIDNTQDGWRITYATNAELTENMHAITVTSHENYTLSGLTPETHYYVAVCAFCGASGYGAASNIINFTTDIACQKPTNLDLVEEEGNPTQTTAKLSWTESGLASAWTIAYKAEGADEFIERMIINDPTTTLNNLTQGTNYTVKVRAICGGDYGNSQWSDEFNFQTIASCSAPENLAVTDNSETAHGATITWDGEADSYNIEYAEGPLAGLATLLDEGFEGGSMPTGWTSEGNRNWIIGTGDFSVSTTHNGSYNAKPDGESSGNGDEAYLVTPAMDLSNYENAKLTCWYMNRDWYGDTDGFGVYYRTSSTGAWQQLFSPTDAHTSWTQTAELALPSEAYVQIGFKYTDNYGYGVGLDDITITAEYTPTYSWNTLVSGITEEEYVITELDPQTDYVVRVRGNCSGTLSPESNSEIVGFTTLVACQAPTILGYANLTHNSVDLTWTENGSATKWQICVNGDEENLIDLIASDVTIDGNTITRHMLNLEWETSYTMKVRANCEGEGYSDWSNTENFTTLVGCGQPTNFTPGTVEAHQASFSWTGGVYNESWDVYVKKHSDATYPTTPNTAMTFTPSTTINGLDAETAYDVKIVPNCDENKFLEVPNAFTTAEACPAPTNLAVTDGSITANGATVTWDGTSSDGYVVSVGTYDYTATPITGTILEEDFESGMPEGWTHLGAGSISVQTPSAVYVHGGTHVLRFSGTNSYNLAVMPELPVETNQLTLDFWSRAEGQSSGTFEYGYVTDATDANTFQAIGSWMASTTNNHEHIENISFSSAPDGARIAFRHQSGSSSWYWFIDDITISGPTYPISWTEYNTTDQSYTFDNLNPETFYMVKVKGDCGEEGYSNETEAISFTTAAGCQVPDGLAASNVTNNSATISWNAYGQTGFNLRYSTDGENWTTENDVTNPYLFNEVLTGNTEYQVQVQVTCNTEEWSNVLNFTTKCDALSGNDFPWREDFESYSTGNFSDNCWVNEHISGNGTSIFNVTTSSLGGNSTHKLQLPDQSAGTLTKLVLPAMTLPNANYVFSIDVYRNTNYSDKTGEGIRVYASTDGEIAGATELAFIPRVRTVENGIVPAESADGWYTYQLPIGISGTCYIILRGESQYGNATYMDNFKVAEYSVEKTYQPNKWYAIASPVHDIYGSAQTVGDGTTVNLATDPYDLYSYNEVEGSWMNYKNNPFALEMGMGYIYRHGGDNNRTVSYVGAPNSGDINVTITSDCSDDDLKGFNLLGNPYPHTYSTSASCYTLETNGCWTTHLSGTTIGIAEAFLVSAEEDHFDFTENSSKASSSTSAIAFTVSNGEYEDVAYALLENGHGLPKIGHLNSEAPMLSIPVDNRRYAVAMLGEECQGFDMVFRATTGQYTLTVDNGIEGLSYLHLLDRATGHDIDLLREHTYTFNVTASNADRFSVKLSPEAVESTSAHFAYWNGNNWVVEGTGMLQVYDVTGRCLSTLEVDGKLTTDNGNLGISHTGVYVFRMGEKSQKIVVK